MYRNYSNPDDRMRWLTAVRTALEQNHIGWTMWDYQGGFGVVTKKNGATTEDDGVLRALGLRTHYVIKQFSAPAEWLVMLLFTDASRTSNLRNIKLDMLTTGLL